MNLTHFLLFFEGLYKITNLIVLLLKSNSYADFKLNYVDRNARQKDSNPNSKNICPSIAPDYPERQLSDVFPPKRLDKSVTASLGRRSCPPFAGSRQ